MSKLQLRSKRRTATPPPPPSTSNGLDESESPSIKKAKNSKDSELSGSESSSDEFVRPSKILKSNAKGAVFKKEPSPEVDFSSIEKSIFSGVSRLSDSGSSDSDFEEVPAASTSASVKTEKENFVESEQKSSKSVSDVRNKQSKTKEVAVLDLKPVKDDKSKNTKRVTRGSKRKSVVKSDESEDISKEKVRKNNKNEEIKSEKNHSSKPSLSSSPGKSEKACKENTKSKGRGKDCGTKSLKPLKLKKDINEESSVVKTEVPDTFDHLDIAQLLALGEGLKINGKLHSNSESESDDWEEVDASNVKKHEIPKEGVQITLAAPEFSWRRKKHRDQQACLQAEMNRAFNRVRKELQLLCHKTSLLLWLAHGIFINRVINRDSVKALALSLIPSDLSQIPKKPGKKYIEQLLSWFSKDFECSEGYPEVVDGKSRPLLAVLEQHFSRRYAKSTKELTFMFVTTLRALGVESRLVISFQPMPLKPQSDELLAVNKKTSKSKTGTSSKKESKSNSTLEADHESKAKVNSDAKSAKLTTKSCKSVPKKSGNKPRESSPEKVENKNRAGTKSGRKSAPSTSESAPKRTEKEKSVVRKSEPALARSPIKTRQLRKKASETTYREDSVSENSEKEEDSEPILSPDRKKNLNKVSIDRLKAAAAKRLPPNRRSIVAVPGSSKASKRKSKSQDSDSSDFEPKSKPSTKGTGQKSPYFSKSASSSSDSDSDFEDKPKKSTKTPSKKTPTKRQPSQGGSSKSRGMGMKVLSSDDDTGIKQLTSSGSDYWVEIYLKDEERWTCVDVPAKKVDSSKGILAKATQPVCYVIAFNADGTVKDVTKRYSPKYSQVTVKQRVSVEWWEKSLKPFRPKQTRQEAQEDSEMNLVELDRPMPKSVGECKNHPLYVLKRHLLKFEAIYPPDAPSLGFVRNEAIYARQNVYTLHSREIWIKEAKVVRPGEVPYKIVKARPKYDRLSGKVITDLPLEIFGPWQIEDYVPPPAVDGKVPRNAYGNVELFKPTMLPKGCVHLQVPGLTRVAKKLRIDCAPAVVGFDYHSGGSHPTFDGFVVCEEHVDVLMDAWNKDIDESAKRREEKHEKRVYGNWRRLIRGLLIREALKSRYDFKGENRDVPSSSQSTVNSDVLRASRIASEDGPLPCLFPKLMAKMRSQKSERKMSTAKKGKNAPKTKASGKDQKSKPRGRRKDETSEEEETDWDSSTSEEDDTEMVLLSDEDSGSEFEDLKK